MKLLLGILLIFSTIIAYAQPGSVNVGVVRSKVEAIDTTAARVIPTGYSNIFWNRAKGKWQYYQDGIWNYLGSASFPTQSGHAGEYLTTDGTNVSWAPVVAGVSSVTGTANRITSTGGSTPVIDISASYIGQSSITTLGTIGTGVWNGTAIGDSYISSASTWNAKESALSFTSPLSRSTNTISIPLASGSVNGYLSSTDWTIFNGKASTAYADAKVAEAINDGTTGIAPSEDVVYDALLLKVDKSANLTDLASGPTALKNIGGIERAAVANTQTGATYTLAASDFTTFTKLYLNRATSQTVTIPLNSVTPITAGVTLLGRRLGAGPVTFTIAGGGTIVSTSGANLDPGVNQLWALTKREGTTDTWDLDNGGVPLGSANQLLGVDATGATQEYKTASNGLTAATGTLKLGGSLTADTNLSGAFSFGIGASPAAKLHVVGLGTTTGELLRLTDNTPTTRLSILDNGKFTHATTQSGDATIGFQSTVTTSSTANSQTLGGFDLVLTPSYGANTGVTLNALRIRSTTAAADWYNIVQSSSGTATSQIWNAASIYDFKNSSSTSILRNSAAAISFRGGTASTTSMLEFQPVVSSSVNNNITYSYTGTVHALGTAVTRTLTEFNNDAAITSVNGSTLTYKIFNNTPSFALGTSTMTLTGEDYNPTFTSGTLTAHYAKLIRSGNVGIADNTPSEKLSVAGNIKGYHFIGASTAPSVAAGTGAGTAPTVVLTNATDASGIIDVTTGTTPSGTNATIATITFNAAYGAAPNISLTPANANAAGLAATLTMVYCTSTTTTFLLVSGTTGLTAATQYKWFYHVIQ